MHLKANGEYNSERPFLYQFDLLVPSFEKHIGLYMHIHTQLHCIYPILVNLL